VFPIQHNIGQIIKSLREHFLISQEKLARKALITRSTLSQIELGNQDCPDDWLLSIKRVLNVELLPIYENERFRFRDMLNRWHHMINECDFDAAKEERKKLAVIKLLPQDRELNNLFYLYECKLLLFLNELEEAKAILDEFVTIENRLSDSEQYYYCFNQGTYNLKTNCNTAALEFYLKAYRLTKHGFERRIALYYNIAICYDRLGQVSCAITFLEEARELHATGQSGISVLYLYNFLGMCYASTGLRQRAKKFLDKAHKIALNNYSTNANLDTKKHVGMVLVNYGYTYRMSKDWFTAIGYFDKAVMYLDKDHDYYLEARYQKTRSFIEMGNPLACADLITEGIYLSKGNEVYTAMFEMLKILMSPNEDNLKHLETEILPYFLEKKLNVLALDCSTFIRDYHMKKERGSKMRILEMANIICNIIAEIHEGGVIE